MRVDVPGGTATEWLFLQRKATMHGSQKVYVYSKNALGAAISLSSNWRTAID
jgi:hypothetical protein